jgi:hypothetical protein
MSILQQYISVDFRIVCGSFRREVSYNIDCGISLKLTQNFYIPYR